MNGRKTSELSLYMCGLGQAMNIIQTDTRAPVEIGTVITITTTVKLTFVAAGFIVRMG